MSYFVRSASLSNYVEVARSLGLEPYEQLSAASISAYALLDPDTRIPVEAVGRLLETSAQAAGVQDFGLRMAETRQLANLGALAFAMSEEPTLRGALDSMARYMRLHNEGLATRIEEAEGLVIIREEMLGLRVPGSARQSAELVVGVLYRTLLLFLGTSWRPRSICFTHAAPTSTATHMRVFGMPVLFNQDFDGIVCRAADLQAPLPTYDPIMAQQVRQYLDAMLAQSNTNMVDKVRQLVFAMLPSGDCSVERIAQQLGVDRRTIHQHLSAHGENYSTVLNAVRVELVTRYAENRERPLSEVATLLGFSSLSAFSRWFSNCFGCSVTKWRASRDAAPLPGMQAKT
ncbi:AraC family transcriptional regulator [Cupriavidus sp. AcVe19-1a]|uniref:AraC family transcriptional regulator n=1 Tax=Cupriavidus sp. AcVe19-1a TaxID=2821359 RepID=UPI001AE29DB7|nr:AraC family transcriptional regulator [Cupriavidus sp. AcVe19-1a]MBP0630849.1 AraC family transcriptional regulator [Cupriavidus sp. AcVe19-1a]